MWIWKKPKLWNWKMWMSEKQSIPGKLAYAKGRKGEDTQRIQYYRQKNNSRIISE